MGRLKFSLDLIEIPNPCPVPWDTMQGDDRVRHCSQCNKNVYHLSNMTLAEAEALLAAKEGETCVQLYRRADGTVVTRDCMAVRAGRSVVSALTLAGVSVLALFGLRSVLGSNPNSTFSFVGGGIRPPSYVTGTGGGGSSAPACAPAAPEVAPPPRAKP